jgi:two-component system response regulator WspF
MRIGIVNDTGPGRELLCRLVLGVPGYAVAWTGEGGADAVRRAAQDRPDALLLPLAMAGMDGVEATRRIMAASPCPILLLTPSVRGNYARVCEALRCGGLDAVDMPVAGPGGKVQGGEALLARLSRVGRGRPSPANPLLPPLVALGASTGGPEALAQVLQALPPGFPAAVVVVVHIAAEFAANLVVWLQGRCPLPVAAARGGGRPLGGAVAVAVTDDHLVLRPDQTFAYTPEPADYPFRPSVNAFFESAALYWDSPGVGVLLTGMGSDGARGLAALRQAGWPTIAQDEASSVVYGMPRAAAELHAASRVLPLAQIPAAVLACVGAAQPGEHGA